MFLQGLLYEYQKKLADSISLSDIKIWLENKIKNKKDDLDARYVYACLLYDMGLDKLRDKAEMDLIAACSEVIKLRKNKSVKQHPLDLAKAYTYTAMTKRYAIDSMKNIAEAKKILAGVGDYEKDKEYLVKCCIEKEQNPNRAILFYLDDNDKFIL